MKGEPPPRQEESSIFSISPEKSFSSNLNTGLPALRAGSVKEVTRSLRRGCRCSGVTCHRFRRVRRDSPIPGARATLPLPGDPFILDPGPARVRRTLKSLGPPEAPTRRWPNSSVCRRTRSPPERNLDRSGSPVPAVSPGTGRARRSACIHREPRRTLSI